jgi:hypothetical protein
VAKIPDLGTDVIDRIYRAIEQKERNKFRLTRVGASGIGEECLRAVWYSWRGYAKEEFDGRMLRLFRTGHLQEDRIVNDLKLAGYQVWEKDETTGEQWTYNDETGHFVAKLDGVIRGIEGAEKTPHTLEIKTHSKKSFDEVVKYGVERSKQMHFDQMMSGMLFSGIHRALYVALCKDNEQYHVVRLVFDPTKGDALAAKISSIIRASMPPARISESDTYQGCRGCKMKGVCKEKAAPIRTCRSCQHVEAIQGGVWMCGLLKNELTADDQLKACEHYEVL